MNDKARVERVMNKLLLPPSNGRVMILANTRVVGSTLPEHYPNATIYGLHTGRMIAILAFNPARTYINWN